ncbi:hypothetical protein Ga0102493_112219 [Erythrobacter litoralis]|jgi:hypothetical protein|uniref:Alanyl-tRNA synthetase n=1 Tax=Erythrobacter litoralis TaxID=39960 RepID=A0A074ML96_9SPHN|nr:hypothetical protein [Erythrobacter litoralis]AOL23236.1 hypothetical protein Ga0102493_112219 [Erythrobacter litoralis]KEO92618.1 alanyl-tRNA synthetase [Erythrobacter litoralis]MEE4339590.1 hypothetical protein [Erythrobacter sp.]
MGKDIDPTKPIPNDEKFKPQNVKGPLKDRAPNSGRGKPGDTEGDDIEQGSQPVTNKRPSR